MSKTVCIIPARGGSKRVPNKNKKELAGQPLLEYTLTSALKSDIFGEIIVSSGDKDILSIAENMNVSIDDRPQPLQKDTVRAVEVVEDLLKRRDIAADVSNVAMILPTCPFRTAGDIINAYDIYEQHDEEIPVVSIVQYDFPPTHALARSDDGLIEYREPSRYEDTTRSQDIPDYYHPNGAVYLAPISTFLDHGKFYVEPIAGYCMPPERSIDIDEPHDFLIADLYMSYLKEKGER
jgi:N-acylneuraminate cytidylyltransferase